MKEIRFARSARKHRIGRAHAMFVMASSTPVHVPAPGEGDDRVRWEGPDDRGLVLEVVAVVLAETLLVIHVMPAHYRSRRS